MNIENNLDAIKDFFDWMEENTLYELTEYSGGGYYEEDGYHMSVEINNAIQEYKDYLEQDK